MSDLSAVLAALERIEERLDRLEHPKPERPTFVNKKVIAEFLGCSQASIDNYKSQWVVGAHWVVQPNGRPLFNLPLIQDWRNNAGSPQVHQKAVQKYLRGAK